MYHNTIFIISAPSGTGKTSIIQTLLKQLDTAKLSISYTTRKKRPQEKNGEHYHFIPYDQFDNMIKQDKFLEYTKIFGNFYGTSRIEIEKLLSNHQDILLDINWQGANQIRQHLPQSCSIFILPPSKNELMKRLCSRGQDSRQSIKQRFAQAVSDMKHYKEYDYVIINDNYNQAVCDLNNIIHAEKFKLYQQIVRNNVIISELLTNSSTKNV
ncbi:MAG: guanylate kinase [Candidatus Dasytiphilus stammeri]